MITEEEIKKIRLYAIGESKKCEVLDIYFRNQKDRNFLISTEGRFIQESMKPNPNFLFMRDLRVGLMEKLMDEKHEVQSRNAVAF